MTSSDEPRPPEGLVAGKYRITRLLGRGGMGSVWEGVHESLGTRVAVKFIDSEHATSDEIRQRFVNEARAAARLRSKHVVQVYDQGVGEDGRPYIVMEFLAGEPLDARLERLGRLSPLDTARITLHVCRALSKAHDAGIVHRDLKPENVFLVHDEEDQTDVAKVVDFGIAKFTDTGTTGSSSTRTGAVLGTPQYMSPEQARGLRAVDRRTDLWSLGVIVYRALTGVLPFKGEAVGDLLVNVCTADAPLPSSMVSDVPPGFDDWMRRALAREPERRFQSAAELCDSLAEVCGLDARLVTAPASGEAPVRERAPVPGAVTASPFATTPAPSRPHTRLPWAALALLFVVVTAGVVFIARSASHPAPEPGAEASPAAVPPHPSGEAPEPAFRGPEVTPAAAPVASVVTSSGAADAPRHPAPGGKAARHPAAAPPSAPALPHDTPKPQRRPDLLGY